MPDLHAMLAPSAAKRWMTCTPSALVESKLPAKTSVYAEEGTLAHATAEALLRYYIKTQPIAVCDNPWQEMTAFAMSQPELSAIEANCNNQGFDFREIVETVHDGYVSVVWSDYVRAKAEDPEAVLLVEQRVDLSDYVPESFGSSDAIIIWKDQLSVYDLKYGKGVRVSAKGNPQMRLYALGALIGPAELYAVVDVRMTIVQPRLHAVSSDKMLAVDLVIWATDTLSPLAKKAFQGKGDFVPGDHCEFCRAKPTCKALAEYTDRVIKTSPEVEALGPADLAMVLTKLPTIETWIAGVKAKAQEIIEAGGSVPGWKLVEGRSVRKITQDTKAREILRQAGFGPGDYDKVELKGITELTKLVGGAKTFNTLLGDLVEKTVGKPTLAPEDDPRANYNPAAGAEAAFKEII